MRRFWSVIVADLIRDRAPTRIVEIGSQAGESTSRLLELCEALDAHLDVIDPVEMHNYEAIRHRLEAHGAFHRGLSLEVLPRLPPAEVYLVDGDHNWYTVHHELRHIHEATRDRPGPLIVLHDVDWPYGRRDLYYDPASVPEGGRQAIVQGGLRPGRSEVVPDDGLNAHLHHADHEGGPQNGVRTAIEDFVALFPDTYRFVTAPGINGLGFVYRTEDTGTAFARRIEAYCALEPAHRRLVERLEAERLLVAAELEARRRSHARDVQTLQRVIEVRDRKILGLQRRLSDIVDSRGYRALQRVRALRRRVRPRR